MQGLLDDDASLRCYIRKDQTLSLQQFILYQTRARFYYFAIYALNKFTSTFFSHDVVEQAK